MNLSLSRTFFKPRSGEGSVAHGVSRGDRDTNAPEAAERRNPHGHHRQLHKRGEIPFLRYARRGWLVYHDG
ncbi:MAG: hypothetical protein QOH70_3750 [Blastocatellia bacterium]|jgi:hypothetical protein|nr:hypothetical protein [Blastocatellia bacterium]